MQDSTPHQPRVKTSVSSNRRLSAIAQLKRHNHELAILKEIAEELNRALDVRSALENALDLVTQLFGLKTGWVWLLDEANGAPYLAASRMLPPFLKARPSRMQGSGCLCLRTFLAGDANGAANVNVLECSRLEGEIDGTNGLRFHASIPIYAHDKPLGVMNVASSDWRKLEANDLELLYIIGYQIGVAVERARLFDQTTRLATAEERNRLAREIHDTIAQGMAAAILNLESAEALLESGSPSGLEKARGKLRKALVLTRSNLEEARRSVMDLRAAPLQEGLLAEALANMVALFVRETGMEARFEIKGSTKANRRYPAPIEAAFYRVAQEALTNVQKHAGKAVVEASLETELRYGNEQLRLVIHDNGRGFDAAKFSQEGNLKAGTAGENHFGLIGMAERAHLLKGQVEIESSPGTGTRIEFRAPLS